MRAKQNHQVGFPGLLRHEFRIILNIFRNRHPVACPPAAPPPRTLAFAEVAAVKVEPIPGKKLAQSSKKCFQGYLAMGEGEFALRPARNPCSDEFLGVLRGQGNQDSPAPPTTPKLTLHIPRVTRQPIYRSKFEACCSRSYCREP